MAICESCGKTVSWVNHWDRKYCEDCYKINKREEAAMAQPSAESPPGSRTQSDGMLLLFAMALLAFCIAGLGLLVALFQESLGLAILSAGSAISGVLFLAINRIIIALEDIREAVAPTPAPVTPPPAQRPASEVIQEAADRLPTRGTSSGFTNRRSRRGVRKPETGDDPDT